ncbi:1-aminocyclopropane-1-carboxylate oxidase homolog 1-like [Salvia miltiorrhiza]|uniref:1-aminocyclopropane-1-carboxylate oxidase homolog 1-like n=1 Tax=Salvia miltiorrhiza TaxID=226208 RepID=UPI0025ABE2C0|nr:1-aminocyclopropane-1-carboxylate oxidase homolog 1-like [Salvia miltiorrhiza]
MAGAINFSEANHQNERSEMLKAFDATKSGVKGLIGSGLSKIPQIFARSSDELAHELTHNKTAQAEVPLIDLTGICDPERRDRIVEEVRIASETWGFFQVTNHGIPQIIIDEMIDGVNKFNDMAAEEKEKYYTRDLRRRVRFNTNFDLFNSKTANWRDTLGISFAADGIPSDELPAPCREIALNYSKHVVILGEILLELLSEALGLKPDYLKSMKCANGHLMNCHYYPACPEPELAVGTAKHSDIGFITILAQNEIDGLQVMYRDQWIDVHPLRGGLIVNNGDLLQVLSNGKFISNKHRVVANNIGPRISVACFFSGPLLNGEGMCYGPIEELLSEENPPKYREIVFGEYVLKFTKIGLDQYLGLDYYKL